MGQEIWYLIMHR